MANGSETFNKITEILDDEDVKLTIQQRDGILLAAMRDIYKRVNELDAKLDRMFMLEKRIEALENKSIVLWAERHPKAAVFVGVLVFSVLNMWFVSDFRQAVLIWLGMSPSLLP